MKVPNDFEKLSYKAIVVCTEPLPRLYGDIEILPYNVFLERLWEGEIIG